MMIMMKNIGASMSFSVSHHLFILKVMTMMLMISILMMVTIMLMLIINYAPMSYQYYPQCQL